jgi:hypothetical protein
MFSWNVSAGGYCMIEGRELQNSRLKIYLVECPRPSKAFDAPVHDGLFREFSELSPDGQAVVAFAERYGALGKYELMIPAKSEPGEGELRGGRMAESLETWQSEIVTMYRLLRIWDSISDRGRLKRSELEQDVDYSPDRILYRWKSFHDQGVEVVALKDNQPWLFAKLNENKNRKLSVFLSWYLQMTVNEKLKGGQSSARLLWDRQEKRLGLSILPLNLLGFLWLQFAKAIEGDISHRRCEDCGKWFALGGRAGRSDKRYCSGTCKARSHRTKRPA